MPDGIQLTVSQQFEQERLTRAIESTTDPIELQTLAKQLLQESALFEDENFCIGGRDWPTVAIGSGCNPKFF